MKTRIYLVLVLQMIAAAALMGQSWNLTGNSGTTSTHYIGTSDSRSLIFKTNKSERLRILSTGNIGIGVTAPVQRLDVGGNINIKVGSSIYFDNHKVISADFTTLNLLVGSASGVVVTGKSNTSIGNNALYSLTSGQSNTAVGTAALFSNNGSYNTAVGNSALSSTADGYGLTAMGAFALAANTSGSSSTGIGMYALNANTTGNYNNALGWSAMYFNTTGNSNIATGYQSMYNNITGSENIAYGNKSLYANSAGNQNTAIGTSALDVTQGSNNVAVGYMAGSVFNNGYNNVFIGSAAKALYNNLYNSMALGSNISVSASNQVRIGNSYVSSIGGWANWTNVSDGRVKRNIKEDVPGLAFINKLRPVTYILDLDAAEKIMFAGGKDRAAMSGQELQLAATARQQKQQIVQTGFIAQDVEKAAKELQYNFSGVDVAKNEKDLYGLRYSEFIMPMVKALQELSQMQDSVRAENKRLHQQLTQQQEQINELRKLLKGGSRYQATGKEVSLGSLEQNKPNPAGYTTSIVYTLPENFRTALLMLTDNSGRTVQQRQLNGTGLVTINTGDLTSGSYHYSLVVDGLSVATKHMTVIR